MAWRILQEARRWFILPDVGRAERNQEIVLSAANEIAGLRGTAIFSVGSHIFEALSQNDAYPALKKADGLIITGATGTNVNDVAVLLIKR